MKIFFNIVDIKYMLQGLEMVQNKFKDKNKSKMVTKPCLQFHHFKLGGNDKLMHWILLHCYSPLMKHLIVMLMNKILPWVIMN